MLIFSRVIPLGFLLPVCSSPRLLWWRLCSCWAVCTALGKSIPCFQKLIHPSISSSLHHFTFIRQAGGAEQSFLCPVKLLFKLQEGHVLFQGSVMVSRAAEPTLCWWSALLSPAAVAHLVQWGKPTRVSLQEVSPSHFCCGSLQALQLKVQLHCCCIPGAGPSQHFLINAKFSAGRSTERVKKEKRSNTQNRTPTPALWSYGKRRTLSFSFTQRKQHWSLLFPRTW